MIYIEKVYVQTASFSNELRADFHRCMEKIASAGYSGIEIFDAIHGGYGPKELEDYLGSLGMDIIGSHVRVENTDEQLKYLGGTSCKYMVCPGIHVTTLEEAYAAAETLNEIGSKASKFGIRYGYHNHNSDFTKFSDDSVIDILIKNTDPSLVFFELDAGWAWRAGINAADFIRENIGRFELIHVKETSRVLTEQDSFEKLFAKYGIKRERGMRQDLPAEMQAELLERRKVNCKLGEGITDVPSYVKAGDAQGTKAYIVEREYAYTGDIFTSLAEDCAYLKGI